MRCAMLTLGLARPGLVKKTESTAAETTERCDFLLKSLGEEKTMKENFERLLQVSSAVIADSAVWFEEADR